MDSPFPGIDPYLEAQGFWPDFHSAYLHELRSAIFDVLPENYEARIEERFQVIDIDAETAKRIGPDLTLAQLGPRKSPPATGGTVTLEPVTIPLSLQEEIKETFLKILWRPNRSIVTLIELLSPANKEAPGRNLYLTKRREIVYQPIHLMELDLLLGGRRMPLEKPYPPGNYFDLLSHAERRPNCDVYAWSLAEPLPQVPIPLKAPDKDLVIDLNGVYRQTFAQGRYSRSIDYREPLRLPLDPETLAWAKSLVAGKNGAAPRSQGGTP